MTTYPNLQKCLAFLAVLFCLLLAVPAMAQGGPPDNRPPDNRPPGQDGGEGGNATATATGGQAESTAISGAESTSEANAQVTVNITPGSNADSQAAPVTNTLTVNQAEQPSSVKIRNTPTTIAPDIMPTVSCFKGASASIAVPGFGASGAAGKIDQDCVKREYIRLAYAMGAHARAIWMWCQQPAVWTDFGSREECLQFDPVATADLGRIEPAAGAYDTPPPPVQQYVTVPQLEQADQRILETAVEPLQQQVQATDERLEALERRLDANARAAARAEQEREQWKQELATKYLGDDEENDGGGQ